MLKETNNRNEAGWQVLVLGIVKSDLNGHQPGNLVKAKPSCLKGLFLQSANHCGVDPTKHLSLCHSLQSDCAKVLYQQIKPYTNSP